MRVREMCKKAQRRLNDPGFQLLEPVHPVVLRTADLQKFPKGHLDLPNGP